MPKLERLNTPEVAEAAAEVSVEEVPEGRVITIALPEYVEMTEERRRELEENKDQEMLAICDVTGEPIFKAKNVNEIHNGEREEFDGLTVSTKFLKELLAQVAASK